MGCRQCCFQLGKTVQLRGDSKIVGWFPVAVVVAFTIWSWYAFVIELCVNTVSTSVEFGFYIAFYHLFLLGMLASYYRAIMTEPDPVPENFQISDDLAREVDQANAEDKNKLLLNFVQKRLADRPTFQQREYLGTLRYCHMCRSMKPDRAHHCSTCCQCVLRMDHHCPWVNNCVHWGNHKFFILFLMYASLLTIFSAFVDLGYAVPEWKELKAESILQQMNSRLFHILAIPLITFPFMCMSVGFFFNSLSIVTHNETTLEEMSRPIYAVGPRTRFYDLGFRKNFVQIFGRNPCYWFLPVDTNVGDGCHFESKEAVDNPVCDPV